jgi:integrase
MVGTRDLDDLWAEFAAERRRALRRPDVDEALWANHAAPALGVLRPADMTADRYRRLVGEWTRAGAKPNTIRTRHRVVARFFAWLVERGHLTASPIPASPGVPRVERDRVPSLNEMRALWAWGAGAGTGGQVVRLILATGLRKQEAADLLWSEVEPDRLVIGAARMKGKRSHVVPLSRAARIVLAHQRARVGAWSLHVFPARRRGVETSRPTQAALSEAVRWSGVVEGVTVHDLRRGLATALGDAGVPPHVLAALLAHSPGRVAGGGVTGVYVRSQFLGERQAALDLWADLLLSTAKPDVETEPVNPMLLRVLG